MSAAVSGPSGPINTMRRKSFPYKERSLYDDDLFVSPISDRTPSWTGTRWTRFFPELSSHFSLVSPVSTHHQSISSSSEQNLSHRSSTASEETADPRTGPSSLWSDELADDASSCYSRRSSVTSLGSEPSASAYKSADAFSIISPTRAGVFDDSASVYRSGSKMSMRRSPSVAESKNKPLPSEPPIQMAPLSIRRKKKQPETITEDALDEFLESIESDRSNNSNEPTLSQAAEELENALAGLVEHNDPLPRLDTPLQVSRGKMDMIASRPAPIPPISPLNRKKASNEDMIHAKKPHKGRASWAFTVPGFGKKVHRPHLRSLSGSNVVAGVERKHVLAQGAESAATAVGAATASTSKRPEKDNAGSGFLSPPQLPQRPASVSSERELRLKLPRLQTKEVRSSGMWSKPLDISAAETLPKDKPKPKPRKTFSFEPEGTMSKSKLEIAGPSKPVGPYCEMSFDSGPIVIYELDAGLPSQQIKSPVTAPPFVPRGEMPGTLPDAVVASILRKCGSLADLFNFAVMNRQFYRVFKQHELDLIKDTVYAMSPPAWELREMSPPWDSEWQVLFDLDAPVPEYSPSIYLDRYTRDLYTLVKLKSLILARCGTFLRPETVRGLAGIDDARASEIDDAFWRVWTFCRIFGCGKNREGDVVGQVDWLNGGIKAKNQHCSVAMSITEPFGMNNVLFEPPEGFGGGNHGGLSQSQLYDMTEIWTCLGVLLQPIHGKCKEARKAGVFDGHDAPEKDPAKEEATLEEWTSYILTLGPSAVLALGSIATVDNANEIFQRAQSLGLTKWEPADASRSFFFREAVSRAYKPRQTAPRKSRPLRQSGSNSSESSVSSSGSSPASPSTSVNSATNPHRRRQAAYAAQLRNRRNQNADLSYIEERPISSYAEIMNRLAGAPAHPLHRPSLPNSIPPPPPSSFPSTAASPPLPSQPATRNIQIPYSRPPRPVMAPVLPQIRDPADQAIDMMVRELGFKEEDAKWALKITDTGEGINPNAAVSLLMQEYQRQNQGQTHGYAVPSQLQPGQRNSILSSHMQRTEGVGLGVAVPGANGWRWA
ncbi:hypothetical protein BJY04DRAFT_215894 [Aspergillus karnatakaensis]|uniref:uncharacterized protein n=1 Tax=Aspergillus karnatakaensis TaxID=1810916 RepID=UPI003CCD3D45